VPLGKLKTERMVPVDAFVCRLVDRLRLLRSQDPLPADGFLLARPSSRNALIGKLRSFWRDVVTTVGITTRIVPHQLRHSFVANTSTTISARALEDLPNPGGDMTYPLQFAAGALINTAGSGNDFVGGTNGPRMGCESAYSGSEGYKEPFDFRLEWEPNSVQPTDDGRLSLFDALQQQLGLKLEPQKAPLEVLVIDHVEQPSAN
jgi:hypothetical protein